jgi:methylated-DNA-[protein]-cysteine S-methyltransferase
MFYYNVFLTKSGYASLVSNGKAVIRFFLPMAKNNDMIKIIKKTFPDSVELNNSFFKETRELIKNYFKGMPISFNMPVEFLGVSDFVKQVLNITYLIPYGETRTYKWISDKIGSEDMSRAVGTALSKNPIPVIVPCHRVIQSNGEIGGYSYGLKWKIKLLQLEKIFK